MVTGGKAGAGGGINWEIGIDIYTLLYIKEINNKYLLYSTGNYIQYLVISYNGRESVKENIHTHTYIYIYIYITESLCCIPETL